MGFTLLEMLVVVVVLGYLMGGLTQGVRSALALWDAQTRRLGETVELDAAARILRTLLSGIMPSPTAGFGPVAASAAELKGTADSLAFVGDLPAGLGTTQRAHITLELRQGRIVLRWTPHRHELSNTPATAPIETELIRRVGLLLNVPIRCGSKNIILAAFPLHNSCRPCGNTVCRGAG
jgi:prepilin-type N-terminal cleavage/methylation domain-containing protein